MESQRYVRAFRHGAWLIAAALLVAVAVGLAVNPLTRRDYEAAATVSVPAQDAAFYLVSGVPPGTPSPNDGAALALLRSRDVAERTIKQLNLAIRPDELQHRVSASMEQGSGRIRVTATAGTPQDAVALANGVAETGAAYDQERQTRAGALAVEFVQKQADEALSNLRRAEDALLQFKQKHEYELSSPKAAQLAMLQSEDQSTALSLNEIEAKLADVRSRMGVESATRSDREISDNPIAQSLQGQLVSLEVDLNSELALHTEKYPSVVALKAKIDAVKDRLNQELSKVISRERVQFNPIYDALTQERINLETGRVAAQAKREGIRQALARVQGELPGMDLTQLEQSRLSRTVEILSKDYVDLQGRLLDARLKEQQVEDLGSLTVNAPAESAHPVSLASKLSRLALAALVGLLGGVAVVGGREYLDASLKTTENAERLTGLPVLAAVPRHNPPFDEAYRLLRANLAGYRGRRKLDAVVVTAPRPRSGTSTVVANAAQAFALAGRRTIIVDAGLQRATQHLRFGVPNEKGLAQILAGEAGVDDVLVETEHPNLWLLPSGLVPEQGREVLHIERLAALLAELKERADVILIDTQPAGVFADALTLAPFASGVLLVLDARRGFRAVEEQVKGQLKRLGVRVFGIVLNSVCQDLCDSYVYHSRLSGSGRGFVLSPATAALGLVVLAALGMATYLLIGPGRHGAEVHFPAGLMRDFAVWTSSMHPWGL